jgi:hypothetical protein
MTFTVAMMAARLAIAALSSLGAGAVAAWITKTGGIAVSVLPAVLVAAFVPLHYTLWDKFPLWYHAVFFALLALATIAGAFWYARGAVPPSAR